MGDKRIEELERQIEQLKNQFPAHTIPPAMMEQLDGLEDMLEEALKKLSRESKQDEKDRNH